MGDNFCVRDAIDRYTTRITRGIRSRRRRQEVRAEYADHIEDMMMEYAMRGIGEEEAFAMAREQLGDETKIEELLRVVHNKDKLPSLIRVPLCVLAVLGIASSYFWIDNRTFRAWYIFACEIALLLVAVLGAYWVCRFSYGVKVRLQAYLKLRAYAKANGCTLTKNRSICKSLFYKTSVPEITLDTGKVRYIINLWATMRKRKTLRLLDNGLYSYASNIGYMQVYTYPGSILGPGWGAALRFLAYLPHYGTDMTEIPKGMHLMPKIDWETYERADRENVRILMLNPIPLFTVGVERGAQRKLLDDASFGGMRIWSASGFLSYLEGIRIKESQ